MKPPRSAVSGLIALLSFAAATPTFAQPSLVKSTPAAQSTVSNVKALTLTFSSAIDGPSSGAAIVMTSMPGMANHAPMTVTGFKTSLGTDGKTLTLTLPRALPAGTYTLSWHAVTSDRQRQEGKYDFAVR